MAGCLSIPDIELTRRGEMLVTVNASEVELPMPMRHLVLSLPALGAAVVVGLLEWFALWRSRRRAHSARSPGT
jgi:hypothetical protein